MFKLGCRGNQLGSLHLSVPLSWFSLLPASFFSPGTKPESASERDTTSRLPCVSLSPGFCLSLCPRPSPSFFHFLPPRDEARVRGPRSSGLCHLSVPPPPYLLCRMGTNLGPESQPGFPTSGVASSVASPGRRRLRSASPAPVVPVEV